MSAAPEADFQSRTASWLLEAFGPAIATNPHERSHRFLEEALELSQACGCTREEAIELVNYTFDRPVGEPKQETGGVMVTLAGLCFATGISMTAEAERELARVWTKIAALRAKRASKPAGSPLPGVSPEERNK